MTPLLFLPKCRVNSYIKYGWDKNLINLHGSTKSQSTACRSVATGSNLLGVQQYAPPTDGWKPIKQAFESHNEVPTFNNGHIVSYFVTRSVIDGLPSGDFKSINSSAENLFRCGHIQHIEVCKTQTVLYVRASCLPEMRKDRVYKLNLALSSPSFDIMYASCGCPAGMGPTGSCKHISALCYAFSDFCKSGSMPTFLTCTDQLQSWNKPRGRKVEPIPVDMLCSRRSELTNKSKKTVVFDPRPQQFRVESSVLVENLRCDLLNSRSTESCALLTVLVPSLLSIQHDHTYASPYKEVEQSHSELASSPSTAIEDSCLTSARSEEMQTVVEKLCLTSEQRQSLEFCTREQNNRAWHQARRCRITGSKCGRVLIQKTRTVALLRFCLYPRSFNYLPKQIEWGRKNEPVARKAYVEYMHSHGHPKLTAHICGFLYTQKKGG